MPRQSLVLAVSSDTNHRSTKPRNKPSVMPIMIRHSTAVTVRIDLAWLTDNKPRERETSVREIMRWRGDNFAGITQETIYISNISISYFTRNFSLFIISLFHLNPTVTSNSKKREFNFDKILFTVQSFESIQFFAISVSWLQFCTNTIFDWFITNYYILKEVE